MMRVVAVPPGEEEIAASGLTEKDFRTDPEAYRHFVEQFRRNLLSFQRTFHGTEGTGEGSTVQECAGSADMPAEETCLNAFERSLPPYFYRRGSFYRYRIDPAGSAEQPITLERFERSEITGALAGIPFISQREGLLMRFCLWIEKRLGDRQPPERD